MSEPIEQKAVIISVTPLGSYQFKDKTNYKFGIIYTGSPDLWEYHTSKQTQTDFVAGQEAKFTTETKQNGTYTNRRIKPVKAENSGGGFNKFSKFGGGGGNQKTPEQLRLITLQGIFGAVCTLGQGKATVDQAWEKTKEVYDKMMTLAYVPHPVEIPKVEAPATPQVAAAPIQPNPINPTPQVAHVPDNPNNGPVPF